MLNRAETEEPIVEESDVGDEMRNKFLTFKLGDEEYGVDIRYVTQIVGVQDITCLPDVPDYIKGVINLRGYVLPVIDVRTRFGMNFREFDERTCFIVVNIHDFEMGLIVDEVSEVLEIQGENIEPPSSITSNAGGNFIKGLGKVNEEIKILLDIDRLVTEDIYKQIDVQEEPELYLE